MKKYCWLLFALLLPLDAAFAIGEQYGRITGIVYDPDGAELRGAKLTLTSPNLLGGARHLISAEDGSFTFNSLSPGKYELTVENQGLRSYKKTGIVVRVGKTSSIYIATELATDENGVLLSPSTQTTANVIDTSELTQGGDFTLRICDVPEGRSYKDIVPPKTDPTVGDTGSKFIGSEFVQSLPKEGQSLQAFVLEFPRTEVKNSTLRMNGQPVSFIENGQRTLPPLTKQPRY